jgi:hypothetical protein
MPKPFPAVGGVSQEDGFAAKLPTYTKVSLSGDAAALAADGIQRGGNITAAVHADVDFIKDLRLRPRSLRSALKSSSGSGASFSILATYPPLHKLVSIFRLFHGGYLPPDLFLVGMLTGPEAIFLVGTVHQNTRLRLFIKYINVVIGLPYGTDVCGTNSHHHRPTCRRTLINRLNTHVNTIRLARSPLR